jgi:hypothetical protein
LDRAIPPEVKTLVGVPVGASIKLSKEALKKAGGEGGMGRGAARLIGYPAIGYGAYDYFTGDDEKKTPPGSDRATVPEIEESDALLDIIRQTSLERAQAAGRTEPTFIDYLASFPSSYMEKVERDPEFAKQMMAGFVAMTRTTEGFAPRNALTDFVQGVEGERIRQEDATPDQIKLFKELQANPELLESYKSFIRSSEPVDLIKEQENRELLFKDLQKSVIGEDFDEDDLVYDKRTNAPTNSRSVYDEWLSLGGDTAAFEQLKRNFSDTPATEETT